MPLDLGGMSVLDVGAWDGAFSFEAERRGAERILATDSYVWNVLGRKAGFDLAKRALRSKVEEKSIAVEDISPETVGVFDLVLFLGVLYHLEHPFLGLQRMAQVTRHLCIIETWVDALDQTRPMMVFYPGDTLHRDPTNWWGPNPACVVEMCKEAGFNTVHHFACTYAPSRQVFHAYK
jgi:tRNA (mo5U34)-methyltransferase